MSRNFQKKINTLVHHFVPLFISCLVLLWGVMIYLIHENPAKTYELTIYSKPVNFVISIYVLLFILSIVISRLLDSYNRPLLEIFATFVLLVWMSILFLHLIKGYFLLDRGDILDHLGRMKDIHITGHVGKSNFYPLLHILGYSLATLSGVSLRYTVMFFPPILSGVFAIILFLYTHRQGVPFDKLLIAMPTIAYPYLGSYHYKFYPNFFSLIFLTLVFFKLSALKNRANLKDVMLLTILSLAIIFSHPLTTGYLIGIFIITLFFSNNKSLRNIITILLISSAILYISWIFKFYIIRSPLTRLKYILIGKPLSSPYEHAMKSASSVNIITRITLFIKAYGNFVTLVFVSGMWIFFNRIMPYVKGNPPSWTYSEKLREVFYLFTIVIGIFFLVMPVVGIDFGRPLRFVALSLSFIWPYIFINIFTKKIQTKNIKRIVNIMIIILILTTLWILPMSSLYKSPYILLPNEQLTEAEVSGTLFLIYYSDLENSKNLYLNYKLERVINLGKGYEYYSDRYTWFKRNLISILENIQNETDIINKIEGSDGNFLVVSIYDKVYYKGPRKSLSMYSDDIFTYLNARLSKTYSNQEINTETFSIFVLDPNPKISRGY